MQERYWLRHPSLKGLLGPYRLDDLRAATTAGSLPADSHVLRDSGQDEAALREASDWRPVTDVLGLPRPATTHRPAAAPAPAPTGEALRYRDELRRHSAYATTRKLITFGAVLAIVVDCVWLLATAGSARGLVSHTETGLLLLAREASYILLLLIVAGLLQAYLDIADAKLQDAKNRGGR